MVANLNLTPSERRIWGLNMPKMTNHRALVTLGAKYPKKPQNSASFTKMTNVVILGGLGHLSRALVILGRAGRFGEANIATAKAPR